MPGIDSGNMDSARMATVTAVTFTVAFAPVLYGLADIQVDPHTGDCSTEPKGEKDVNVSQPNTTVTLKCKDPKQVKPPFDAKDFKVCTEDNCDKQQKLSDYIEGATVQEAEGATAKITINNLPSDPKVFYIQCGTSKPDLCYIVVRVSKASSGSGEVTTGGPQSCAAPGGAITIRISEKGSKAQFTCGDWILYPVAADRVFAEDCKKEESLKGLVRSTQVKVHTLTADKKPPKKKWCFLCARPTVKPDHLGAASDYCLVHVESSSRTQSSSLIALAAMLPCVLAMLRIT